jgi:hypothetical protein
VSKHWINGFGAIASWAQAGGAESFAPSDISGLTLWLDAENGITKDGSNKVSQWLDGSTNALAFTNANSAEYPTWVANVVNGKPVIRFTSTTPTRLYNEGAALVATNQPFTFITVVKTNSTAAVSFIGVVKGKIELWYSSQAAFQKIQCNPFGFSGAALRMENNPATLGSVFCKMVYTYQGSNPLNANSYTVKIDGVSPVVTAGTNAGADNVHIVGEGYKTNAFGNAFQGDIAGWFLWNKVLSASELTQMDNYISARWGI